MSAKTSENAIQYKGYTMTKATQEQTQEVAPATGNTQPAQEGNAQTSNNDLRERRRRNNARMFEERKHKIVSFLRPNGREFGPDLFRKQRVAALTEILIDNANHINEVNLLIAPDTISRNMNVLRRCVNVGKKIDNGLLFSDIKNKDIYLELAQESKSIQDEIFAELNKFNQRLADIENKINKAEFGAN